MRTGQRARNRTSEAERLLKRLAEDGAFAVGLPDDGGRLAVYIVRRGVSLGSGKVSAAAGDRLVAGDCARWETAQGRCRLVATDAGRAKARRDAADGDHRFLAQHKPLEDAAIDVEGVRRHVRIDVAESPLAWLHRRRDRAGRPFVDAAGFAAGERLRADLTIAQILPRTTANWTASVSRDRRAPPDPSAAMTDAVVAARQRVSRALDAVGPDFAGLLVDVCGFLKGLEQVEGERQWPARSGKLILKLALARLAEHYGLRREARGPARSTGIQVWVAE